MLVGNLIGSLTRREGDTPNSPLGLVKQFTGLELSHRFDLVYRDVTVPRPMSRVRLAVVAAVPLRDCSPAWPDRSSSQVARSGIRRLTRGRRALTAPAVGGDGARS